MTHAHGSRSEAGKRVLIVDDDPAILDIVQDFLQEQGFTVQTADNGEEGLRLALENPPDLIVLDVDLPDVKGYDVCKRIRESPTARHTPILMLTAHTLESDELKGFRAGADDYVSKPFKPARLLARIQTAIGRNMRELDANALTHLPGNRVIIEEIQRRIQRRTLFSVLYMDLNNFKAFNDHYGFVRGDEAIKKTADVLLACFSNPDFGHTFLGHVGGDDFVGIVDSVSAVPLCECIVHRFDEEIMKLYDEQDRRAGKISAVDRKGNKAEVPLMGLAIAVVTNHHRAFQHPGEIALIAGDLKGWAKSQHKSAYVVDRRS